MCRNKFYFLNICRKLYRKLIRLQSTTASSTSSSDIYIPNRIERSPTDILKVSKIIALYFIIKIIYIRLNIFI